MDGVDRSSAIRAVAAPRGGMARATPRRVPYNSAKGAGRSPTRRRSPGSSTGSSPWSAEHEGEVAGTRRRGCRRVTARRIRGLYDDARRAEWAEFVSSAASAWRNWTRRSATRSSPSPNSTRRSRTSTDSAAGTANSAPATCSTPSTRRDSTTPRHMHNRARAVHHARLLRRRPRLNRPHISNRLDCAQR